MYDFSQGRSRKKNMHLMCEYRGSTNLRVCDNDLRTVVVEHRLQSSEKPCFFLLDLAQCRALRN
eukprot:scaffold139831_cov39-Prasinocladus_malaysianus.AAC.1